MKYPLEMNETIFIKYEAFQKVNSLSEDHTVHRDDYDYSGDINPTNNTKKVYYKGKKHTHTQRFYPGSYALLQRKYFFCVT